MKYESYRKGYYRVYREGVLMGLFYGIIIEFILYHTVSILKTKL